MEMKQDKSTSEFYARLKQQLKDDTSWPAPYLYKFIVPADLDKIAKIESIFDGSDAQINRRDSSRGTYTSVSIKVLMKSPDAVIEKYIEVSSVEGVISL
jgi:putative lipoic acid-binding regulatory protein